MSFIVGGIKSTAGLAYKTAKYLSPFGGTNADKPPEAPSAEIVELEKEKPEESLEPDEPTISEEEYLKLSESGEKELPEQIEKKESEDLNEKEYSRFPIDDYLSHIHPKLIHLAASLQLSLSSSENPLEIIDLCQKTILDLCKKQQWDIIKNIREELSILNIKIYFSIFAQLIMDEEFEAIAQAIKLGLADDLAFEDFKISSLHLAILCENESIINLFLKYIKIDQKNEINLTPLNVAVLFDKRKMIDFLLEKGASTTLELPTIGNLLHLSIYSWAPYMVLLPLYEELGLFNSFNSDEKKKVYDAARKNDPIFIEKILIKINPQEIRTQTPLFLFQFGFMFEPLLSMFGMYDENSKYEGEIPICTLKHLLHRYHQKFQKLINTKNIKGETPLHIAAAMGNIAAIKLLCAKGAHVNECDYEERTPLHTAALNGQTASVYHLFFHGADVSRIDIKDETALMLAKGYTKEALRDLNKRKDDLEKNKIAPNFNIIPIKSLVFQGGGVKGLGYLRAFKYLVDNRLLSYLENCVGTSAGAYTSAFIAFGYEPDPLEKLMLESPLTNLLDSELVKNALKICDSSSHPLMKSVKACNLFLKKFIDGFAGAVKNPLSLISNLMGGIHGALHFNGLISGKKVREWIDDCLEKQTGIKYCTFKELRMAVEAGKPFKHLYVLATRVSGTPEIVCFNSIDPQWDDLIVSSAVGASGAFPGFFQPCTLEFKDSAGKPYPNPSLGQFLDGGMFANFPVELLDRKICSDKNEFHKPFFNIHTLGFSLFSENASFELKKPNKISTLLKNLFILYLEAQNLIANLKTENDVRIIRINDTRVKTLNFNIHGDPLERLLQSGWDCTKNFFEKDPSKLTPVFFRKDAHLIYLEPHLHNFFPRPKLLNQMKKALLSPINSDKNNFGSSGDKVRLLRLTGAPKSGKTALTSFFAARFAHHFNIMWTIDCTSEDTINDSWKRLGDTLNLLGYEPQPAEIRSQVFEYLEESSKSKRWLLIFDNVHSKVTYPNGYGSVIIISRKRGLILKSDEKVYKRSSEIYVPSFTQEEVISILNRKLPNEPWRQQVRLTKKLDLSPLSIDHAIKYMSKHNKSIKEYLEILNSSNYSKKNKSSAYDYSFYKSWKTLLSEIQHSPLGFTSLLLEIFSLLGSHPIPINWIKPWDKVNYKKAIETSLQYGFVNFDNEKKTLILQPSIKKILLLRPVEKSRLKKILRNQTQEKEKEISLNPKTLLKNLLQDYETDLLQKTQDFLITIGETLLSENSDKVNFYSSPLKYKILDEIHFWTLHAKHVHSLFANFNSQYQKEPIIQLKDENLMQLLEKISKEFPSYLGMREIIANYSQLNSQMNMPGLKPLTVNI